MGLTIRACLTGFLLVPALASCGSATEPPASAAPRQPTDPAGTARTMRSEGGRVTVVATWSGPAAGAVFDVALDTHSVDLDALDLADAILRNDRGETLAAGPWSAPEGGHHRAGILSFDGDGPRFFTAARWIELVLTGVGDLSQRVLRWELDA